MRPSSSSSQDLSISKPRRRIYNQESESDQESDRYTQNQTQQSEEDSDHNDTTTDNVITDNDVTSKSASNFSSSTSLPLRPPLLPSTYINVAPLPIFRGSPSECPLTHLSRFRRVCHANNAFTIPSILRIFPVTLDDQAALWYDLNIQPYNNTSSLHWEHIESAFLNAFLTPQFIDKARSELMTLKQDEWESVGMYFLRMQWLLRKWPDNGLPDGLLKGVFVDGLREDSQDWVVLQRPETLEEAVRLAGNWEQVQSLRAKRRGNVNVSVSVNTSDGKEVVVMGKKCGFCNGGHEEGECEARRKMRELWLTKGEEGLAVANVGDEGGEIGKKREGLGMMQRVMSLERRGQCQCWKHQCWKKLERSSTSVSIDQKINENLR